MSSGEQDTGSGPRRFLPSPDSSARRERMRQGVRGASRLAWSLCVVAQALTVLGATFLLLDPSFPAWLVLNFWADAALMAVAFSTVGAIIASRRPGNPIGWIFCAVGVLSGLRSLRIQYVLYEFVTAPGSLPGAETLALVTNWDWVPYMALLVPLGLLFPDGRLPHRRWRAFIWFTAIAALASIVALAVSPTPLIGLGSTHPNPLGFEGINSAAVDTAVQAGMYVLVLVAAATLLARLHRASGIERQQLKWVAYGGVVAVVAGMSNRVVYPILDLDWYWGISYVLMMSGIAAIPVAIGFAVLKHRLYDIDVIINRTLVYGALTACVVGLYALVVGGLGAIFQAQGGIGLSLFATGIAAVSFAPLRYRLQRDVNRLMYGDRDDPYAVLSRFGRRLEEALAPDAALTTIVETVAQALKLPYAAISLKQGGRFVTAAEHGTPPSSGEPVVLTLAYGEEEIGRLLLAPRAPGELFSASDMALLDDLARQAGVTIHAARLTADLQRSRERLVTAREEERRRLRRDLHDGLGPQLASLTLKQDAARNLLLAHDPEGAAALLADLKAQTRTAIADIKRLVYDLRPPALDEMGLVPAIREGVANYQSLSGVKRPVAFSVEAPDELPPLPAATEVALYRIAQEAMTNVVRHANARTCRVRLSLGEDLELEITDDGVGIPPDRSLGVGLHSMRERAEELGGTFLVESGVNGGSRVLARLPLTAP